MRSKPFFATIIVYVCSLLGSDLSAQQFNLKAGINSTSYILGFYRPNFEDITKIYWGSAVGVKVGAEYVVSLTDFFDADFGLFYAQRRAADEFQQGEEIVYSTLNMNNIELPVNVRWK